MARASCSWKTSMKRTGCLAPSWLNAFPKWTSCSGLKGDGASAGGGAGVGTVPLLAAAVALASSLTLRGAAGRRGTLKGALLLARIMFMASMENSSKYVASCNRSLQRMRTQSVSISVDTPRIWTGISPRIRRYRSWSSYRAEVKRRRERTNCSKDIEGKSGFACVASDFKATGEVLSPSAFRRLASSSPRSTSATAPLSTPALTAAPALPPCAPGSAPPDEI
mmetsp:Transcript_24580/g.54756  ORF Transcript_24580/g.54756 Transcript_24580/m.54756 type:complete len:223 (+) Transcript_24580:773-1441(+)